MNILVTGGAGFIGSHVVDDLILQGNNVIVLDDLSGGFEDNVNNKAVFIKGDICDYDLIKKIFKENKIDFVFHLAAYAAEGLSHFIKRFNYNNNLMGSVNLINQSIIHKVKCFVFTSSIAVYGKNQLPMTEDTVPMPEDSYGIAKYAVELELECSHKLFGLNYIIFRPHNVYGERQNIGDKYRNVIGIFMNQILQNKPLTVFGDGEQSRAFSYIGDVAPVIAKSIHQQDAYNEVYNVGADIPYTVNQLIKKVKEVMDKEPEVNYLDPRNEVVHAYSSHKKAEIVFNLKEKTDLETGLQKMAEWVKQHGAKSTKNFDEIEIEEKLPPSWKIN
ncbi:MAG: GDP-L-fucose synthase [Ignavibacteriaceae bacterium]|nr:GDP-L-fucose synthase [Ignavibacteriaceae bacterium]